MASPSRTAHRRSQAPGVLAGSSLLVVLCVMTALPPAAYASVPEATLIIEAAAAKEAQRREAARVVRAATMQRTKDAERESRAGLAGCAAPAGDPAARPAPEPGLDPPESHDAGSRRDASLGLHWLIDTPPPSA